MRLRRNSFWITILTMITLIACGNEEQKTEIIRPVRYIQVFSTGGNRLRSFSGVAQSGLESKLSFKVPGTIERIAVSVGDKVMTGAVLAQLDLDDYQLKEQQAQAALVDAKAKARNAEANYERIRALYENKSAPRTQLDAARADSESAEAGVQSAKKQLELAELQLSYATLRAPSSGAIADVDVEVNENVQAGQVVVVLTSGSEMEVKVSIPEILIAQIREGSKVTVTFDAIPGKQYLARVSEVGIASVGMVTTFPVTVKLDHADSDIRPGMAAVVEFLFESKDQRERFLVPSHAVGENQKGRFVYIVEPISGQREYGIARLRSVTIGELTSEGLEVFEGLSDGELLVTAGITHISDGQKVKI